eukprot:snap_masked-scaffold_12-processed-gene-3.38-mRNA-1 protein AED:1.00 eAED:1.00 QI:0/-1/0/0/-1/1/1/0/520
MISLFRRKKKKKELSLEELVLNAKIMSFVASQKQFIPNDDIEGQSWETFEVLTTGLQLNQKTLDYFYSFFCHRNKKNTLTLEKFLKKLNLRSSALLKRIFSFFDADDSGELSFEEICCGFWFFCTNKTDSEALGKFIFKVYDDDGSCSLDLKECTMMIEDLLDDRENEYKRVLFRAMRKYSEEGFYANEIIVKLEGFIKFCKDYEVLLENCKLILIYLRKTILGEIWWMNFGEPNRENVLENLEGFVQSNFVEFLENKPKAAVRECVHGIDEIKLSFLSKQQQPLRNEVSRLRNDFVSSATFVDKVCEDSVSFTLLREMALDQVQDLPCSNSSGTVLEEVKLCNEQNVDGSLKLTAYRSQHLKKFNEMRRKELNNFNSMLETFKNNGSSISKILAFERPTMHDELHKKFLIEWNTARSKLLYHLNQGRVSTYLRDDVPFREFDKEQQVQQHFNQLEAHGLSKLTHICGKIDGPDQKHNFSVYGESGENYCVDTITDDYETTSEDAARFVKFSCAEKLKVI